MEMKYDEKALSTLRVLIACEESQTECLAFRRLGAEAFSCDIEPCSGGHPEWHIQDDVRSHLTGWDLIIGHPPCTYMSAAGACRMYPTKGNIDEDRLAKAMLAKRFFLTLLDAPCEHVCIENPRPLKVVGLPPQTQAIQPYQFGEPWSKLTYLWLRGLPNLEPTKILTEYRPYVSCGTSRNKGNASKAGFSRAGGASRVRSRSFPGIADAMALQWTKYLKENTV